MSDAQPVRSARAGGSGAIFNALAGLFLVFSCVSMACVGLVLARPDLAPAFLRPPVIPQMAQLPTLAPTRTRTPAPLVPTLPPVWTATPTPTITQTPLPSETPTETPVLPSKTPRGPTSTPTTTPTASRTPSRTPAPSATGPTPAPSKTRAPFQYTVQSGNPAYLSNYANTAGCSWMGIAGQAFNLDGKSQVGLLVHLEGGGLSLDALTGSKPSYGPAGYEFPLNDHPVETLNTYIVQLRTTAGQPLSEALVVSTFGVCDKNLVLVNFVQNH